MRFGLRLLDLRRVNLRNSLRVGVSARRRFRGVIHVLVLGSEFLPRARYIMRLWGMGLLGWLLMLKFLVRLRCVMSRSLLVLLMMPLGLLFGRVRLRVMWILNRLFSGPRPRLGEVRLVLLRWLLPFQRGLSLL